MKLRKAFPALLWLLLRAQEKAPQYKVRSRIGRVPELAPPRACPPAAWKAACQNTVNSPGTQGNHYVRNKSIPPPGSGVPPRPACGHQSRILWSAGHAICLLCLENKVLAHAQLQRLTPGMIP